MSQAAKCQRGKAAFAARLRLVMATKKKATTKKATTKKAAKKKATKKPSKVTDIRAEIARYSKSNAYVAHHYAEAVCVCGGRSFALQVDDDEGAAVRACAGCKAEHPIGDSDEYLDGAELEECECPCGNGTFAITVAVSLYEGSEDVRWLYLGCQCTACELAAVYADWKNEFNGYRELLAKV